jgi:hypothetical protein
MSKKPSGPVATPPQVKKRMIPTQKTFGFPFFTPTFLIDWYVNRWLQSLVIDQGVVPMKGDSSAGMLMMYQSYIYTKTITENDTTNLQGNSNA